jgi:1-acyl-sn-glycerol-3-phosphate acyltransferase
MILLRSLLFNMWFVLGTAVLSLTSAVAIQLFRPGRGLAVCQLWARSMLWGLRVLCNVRVELLGGENLPEGGAALIASQHQSAFDTIVWLALLPRPVYVMKQELQRIPVVGAVARRIGMISVDRAGGGTAVRRLMRDVAASIAAGSQVVIFPQGTRTGPDEVVAPQPGIAAVAARVSVPVTPVVTDSGRHWGRQAFRKFPGTIHIMILPPLPTGLTREVLLERLAKAWAAGSAELRGGGSLMHSSAAN